MSREGGEYSVTPNEYSISCVCSVTKPCPTLCDPTDCSSPDPSVHGISQAKCWSGLPLPTPRDIPDPGIETASLMFPALAGGFTAIVPPGKPVVNSFRKNQNVLRLDSGDVCTAL